MSTKGILLTTAAIILVPAATLTITGVCRKSRAEKDKAAALEEFQTTSVYTEIFNNATVAEKTKLDEVTLQFESSKQDFIDGKITHAMFEDAKVEYEQGLKDYETAVDYYKTEEFSESIMKDFASGEECVLKYDDACKLYDNGNVLNLVGLGLLIVSQLFNGASQLVENE